jgi:hypothetical protein
MFRRKHFMAGGFVVALLFAQLPGWAADAGTTPDKSRAPDSGGASRPHIDLAFCIDTTGSMQGEIDAVKAKTKEIVARLAGGKPSPVIRVGLVAYRDRGDQYVTKVFPFSENIDQVVKDISSLRADGGGDAPESVNEALHVAVNDLNWEKEKKTLKLLFLIGDAGPHTYPKDYDWRTEAKNAIASGIQINTLGCPGLEDFAENEGVGVFKEVARLSDGKFEWLSYKSEVAQHGGAGGRLGAAAMMSSGRSPSREGYAMGASSRADSNLADVVFGRTRAEAAKKLHMDFKDK